MDIDGGSGRAADAEVAEKVMGWRWVDVPPDYDGVNAGRTLKPPGFPPHGYHWPPKGKVSETGSVPCFTTDVAEDYRVLVKVRETWSADDLADFGYRLEQLWERRRLAEHPVGEDPTNAPQWRSRLCRPALYRPGDYATTAVEMRRD